MTMTKITIMIMIITMIRTMTMIMTLGPQPPALNPHPSEWHLLPVPHHVLIVCWRPYFRASMVLISRVHCLQSPPAGDFGVDDDPANPTHELTIAKG